jgi:hypothetical protein
MHMYVNAKMIPVETVPVEGVNSSVIYLIHCKNHCKCYNSTKAGDQDGPLRDI